jgi:FkbM family methyltransferase
MDWTARNEEMLDFYSQFISPGDLVFDVGVNIGNRTKIFLKLRAEVVAIEPQNECIHILKSSFGNNTNLTVIEKVLGASEGEAELMISNAHTISSLSRDWVEAVKSSGRFSDYSWKRKKVVKMTTLDKLIDTYGIPSFAKIDVEGFEHELMKGLSKPIRFISFEFTPEFIDSTFKCITHLESLGDVLFNYSIGESMHLALDTYVTSTEMIRILESYRHDNKLFGDCILPIHMRFSVIGFHSWATRS